MKKEAERKRPSLVANLGDLNRPFRVRYVRYLGREWWAIDPEDIWPGMVMDLRRLGFESMAMGEEVLVREGGAYEPQMDGPALPAGLKPYPAVNPTIQIRKPFASKYAQYMEEYGKEDELEAEDLEEYDEYDDYEEYDDPDELNREN